MRSLPLLTPLLLFLATPAVAIEVHCVGSYHQQRWFPTCAREASQKFLPELTQVASLARQANGVHSHSPGGDPTCPPEAAPRGTDDLMEFIRGDFLRVVAKLATSGQDARSHREILAFMNQCMQRTEVLHQRALAASAGVYDLKPIPDYFIATSFSFEDTGVKAYLLLPESKSDPAIIAFSGTEDWTDWQQNFTWSVDQLRNMKKRFDDWMFGAYSNLRHREVIVTGHSLGGGLAQSLVATMYPYAEDKVHLVTFNAFQARDAYHLFATKEKIEGDELLRKNAEHLSDGVHYRMEKDPVSYLGRHLGGQTRTLFKLPSNEDSILQRLMEAAKIPARAVTHHFLDAFEEALRDDPQALIHSCPGPVNMPVGVLNATGRALYHLKEGASELMDSLMETLSGEQLQVKPGVSEKTEGLMEMDDEKFLKECNKGNGFACTLAAMATGNRGETSGKLKLLRRGCELGDKTACQKYAAELEQVSDVAGAEKVLKAACKSDHGKACFDLAEKLSKDNPAAATAHFVRACELDEWTACKQIPDDPAVIAYLERACASKDRKDWYAPPYQTLGAALLRRAHRSRDESERNPWLERARKAFQQACDHRDYDGCISLAFLENYRNPSAQGRAKAIQLLEPHLQQVLPGFQRLRKMALRIQKLNQVGNTLESKHLLARLSKEVDHFERQLQRMPTSSFFFLASLYEEAGRTAEARDAHELNCLFFREFRERSCYWMKLRGISVLGHAEMAAKLICSRKKNCLTPDNQVSDRAVSEMDLNERLDLKHFSSLGSEVAIEPSWAIGEGWRSYEKDLMGRLPLHAAIAGAGKYYRSDLPFRLLAEGYDVTRDPGALEASLDAASNLLDLLLLRGADPDDPNVRPLETLIQTSVRPDAVEILLARGANPEYRNATTGKSLLNMAYDRLQATQDKLEKEKVEAMIKLLIKFGAKDPAPRPPAARSASKTRKKP